MINKLITRFIYLTPLKVVTLLLSVLLGAPFFMVVPQQLLPLEKAVYCLMAGLVLSIPMVAILQSMREGNRFWRLLGETRDLLSEAQNLSDLNWLRNGHYSDLAGMLGEAKTREANLMQVAELHRLHLDIDWRNRELMGYYEPEK
jgi:hypothetical protein